MDRPGINTHAETHTLKDTHNTRRKQQAAQLTRRETSLGIVRGRDDEIRPCVFVERSLARAFLSLN